MSSDNPFKAEVQKEIQLSFLMDDDAPKKMAGVVKPRILRGVDELKLTPQDAVAHACHAALLGLFMIGKKLPKGAVSSIHGVNEVAQERHWDSMEAMTWAMTGISRVQSVVPAPALHEIRVGIDEAFMGAGEVFRDICKKTAPPA